jgi:hypothetical protein
MERYSANRGVSKATGINHRSSKAAPRKIPHISQLLKVTISYRHLRFLFPRVGLPWCSVVWPITASGEWKKQIPLRQQAADLYPRGGFEDRQPTDKNSKTQTSEPYVYSVIWYPHFIGRIHECGPGAGQWIVNTIVEWERILRDAGWKVEYHWVL